MTPIPDLIYFYLKDIKFKKWLRSPLMFIVGKLNCSHCVPFWMTIGMLNDYNNLLLAIFINVVVVKLAIKLS